MTPPPIRTSAPLALGSLEDALLALRELPKTVERPPLVRALEDARAAIQAAAALDIDEADHLVRVDAAVAKIADARGLFAEALATTTVATTLEALAGWAQRTREETVDAIVASQTKLLRATKPATPLARETPPFVASVGVPRLHDLGGASVLATVDVSAASVDPIDDAEDDEPDGADAPRTALDGDAALVGEHACMAARDGFGELAGLSTLRRTLPDQPWSDAGAFEERLLATLDALAASARGPAREHYATLEDVARWAQESPVPDAGRAFARTFLLACAEGDAAARAAALVLRTAEPTTLPGVRDALCLGSNPAIGPAMEEVLVRASADVAYVALEVLRHRHAASFAVVLPYAAHPDPQVARAAVHALGVVPSPERSIAAEVLHALAIDPETPVFVAAAAVESLAALGAPRALEIARDRLARARVDVPLDDAARLALLRPLALAGEAEDRERILEWAGGSPEDVRLLGWYGYPETAEHLLSLLASANAVGRRIGPIATPLELAIADALARITGEAPEDPDEIALAREDDDGGLAVHAPLWASVWARACETGRPSGRLRFGRPWTPLATIAELEAPSATKHRSDGCLELALAVAPEPTCVEPGDWVAAQRTALARARELVSSRARRDGAPR